MKPQQTSKQTNYSFHSAFLRALHTGRFPFPSSFHSSFFSLFPHISKIIYIYTYIESLIYTYIYIYNIYKHVLLERYGIINTDNIYLHSFRCHSVDVLYTKGLSSCFCHDGATCEWTVNPFTRRGGRIGRGQASGEGNREFPSQLSQTNNFLN